MARAGRELNLRILDFQNHVLKKSKILYFGRRNDDVDDDVNLLERTRLLGQRIQSRVRSRVNEKQLGK